ncbi:hypothetical protein SADUNF_Sadunf02G0070200 [Salix dunnii]|uniref:GDSL esterase/lipase n=1 Tax=Salix dunnii TaxID=1413687 RepID=A0A835TI93_9ROSI|nr:hypothetical protein SADUNF_Sadunf02G0070200 [Salix dunnii]
MERSASQSSAEYNIPDLPCSSGKLSSLSTWTIFNFGDSKSDTDVLAASFIQRNFPNGETYTPMPEGRCSDEV